MSIRRCALEALIVRVRMLDDAAWMREHIKFGELDQIMYGFRVLGISVPLRVANEPSKRFGSHRLVFGALMSKLSGNLPAATPRVFALVDPVEVPATEKDRVAAEAFPARSGHVLNWGPGGALDAPPGGGSMAGSICLTFAVAGFGFPPQWRSEHDDCAWHAGNNVSKSLRYAAGDMVGEEWNLTRYQWATAPRLEDAARIRTGWPLKLTETEAIVIGDLNGLAGPPGHELVSEWLDAGAGIVPTGTGLGRWVGRS